MVERHLNQTDISFASATFRWLLLLGIGAVARRVVRRHDGMDEDRTQWHAYRMHAIGYISAITTDGWSRGVFATSWRRSYDVRILRTPDKRGTQFIDAGP